MNCDQRAIRFNCHGSSMVGIIDLPERPLPRGVLVVAGQPWSRLGAQRQFAMLARALARRGFAVMRFDRRGVGDSEGRDYNDSDVRAAVQEFCEQVPGVREVVLMAPGSGTANDDIVATASACARIDARVRALLLLDPRRRGARGERPKTAHMLAAAATAPAPIGAALFWRRSQPPRRQRAAGRALAGLAEQLCAFPGHVLVVAGADATHQAARDSIDAGDAGDAGESNRPAPARSQLTQLRRLVERAQADHRVRIVDASSASGAADAGERPDADANAATCASWMVSW